MIIATMIGLSLLSGFFGLFMALPVLGHVSWHLYRRAVQISGDEDEKPMI